MEEDIKYLDKMVKEYKQFGDLDNPEYEDTDRIYQALENLIKGYREQEHELERQKEINTIINKENLDDKYEEALEKVMTKFLNDNVNNDFIPKSKIKEKIEELKTAGVTKTLNNENNVIEEHYFLQDEIDILQELLEE